MDRYAGIQRHRYVSFWGGVEYFPNSWRLSLFFVHRQSILAHFSFGLMKYEEIEFGFPSQISTFHLLNFVSLGVGS